MELVAKMEISKMYPYFAQGQVVKGFGRGSKELGIPTANFPDSVVESLPKEFPSGIYYGWACVGNSEVFKMVMSVGWNPFYKNTKRTMETHVIHTFKDDFYGEVLRVCVLGYIRPEMDFTSVDDLITAIKGDIAAAEKNLEEPHNIALKEDNFFTQTV